MATQMQTMVIMPWSMYGQPNGYEIELFGSPKSLKGHAMEVP
jgi:hypothetical protein